MTTTEEHPLVVDQRFASDDEYASYLIHRHAYEEAVRRFAGKAVCDWGCNIGYGTEMLLESAASVDALDVSPSAVAVARQRLTPRGVDVHLLQGTRSPYPDGKFGGITSFQVIEHVDDVPAYLNEIRRVMHRDGTAMFTTPNSLLRLHPGQTPWNPHHMREFTPQQLREMLEPVFASVRIVGLFGRGRVDEVERARVTRARDAANSWLAPNWPVLLKARCLNALKAVLPGGAVDGLRRLVKGSSSTTPTPARNGGAQYDTTLSTAELYYDDQNLDRALDLLAICKPSRD